LLKTEHYHTDEIEVAIASTEWTPVKTLFFEKHPFNMNIMELQIVADLKVPIEETKGYLGIFIGDEESPRAVIESDLPYSYLFRVRFNVMDLAWGKHKLTVKLKSDHGYKVSNQYLEVYITRFYNFYELIGLFIPIVMLGAIK